MLEPIVHFKRLHKDAIMPKKAHDSDSGFDLYALEDTIIQPGETVVVKTGVAIGLPEGWDASVRPRSGITSKSTLRVQFGTVDNSYKGDIGVIVDNAFPNPSYLGYAFNMMLNALVVSQSQIADGAEGENGAEITSEKLDKITENIETFVGMALYSPTIMDIAGNEVTLDGDTDEDDNYLNGTYIIKKGDKIAQLVVHPYYDGGYDEVDDLGDSDRGDNGFGSTGVRVNV